MNRDVILLKILETYQRLDIHSINFDCLELIQKHGYRVFTYQELLNKNPELHKLCMAYSDEAYKELATKIVAYNDTQHPYHVRFSLAHELGHIVLEHDSVSSSSDIEANYFASNFLAPRMAIHYSKCKNAADVT